MLFTSLQFLAFFVVVFGLYYFVVPDRYRWALLLAASCYFYMAFIPAFILVLLFLIIVDYVLGIQIARVHGKARTTLLIVSILSNLGTLFFFKYFNFFNENIGYLAGLIHWNYPVILLQIALPLGLSFHIFQSLSYVIEVYRGKQQPERHIGIYALYVMFFPQLVAGPIERPQHMLHQFHEAHPFRADQVRRGLERMLWGFFKKLVIADKLGILVNYVYANIHDASGIAVLIAAIAFSYQIYCDFSGYSDIAVGTALVFGYDLTENFNRPYSSRSIAEYWRRWHMSLSNWIRDYLYYPLVFSKKHPSRAHILFSLFVTFVLIGLWHGANWTYVVFGVINGVYMVFALLTERPRKYIRTVLGLYKYPALLAGWQTLVTFALMSAASVFFRATSVSQAVSVFRKIGEFFSQFPQSVSGIHYLIPAGGFHGVALLSVLAPIGGVIVLEVVQYIQARTGRVIPVARDSGRDRVLRWGWYYALIIVILFFGFFKPQAFIYFQF